MPGGRPRYYAAPLVEDWGVLDAHIDEFMKQFSQAQRTIRDHERGWATWEAHCRHLGVHPLAAPFSAFEDLLLRKRRDGHEYSRGTHDTVLAAVGARYAQGGLVPAHKHPANRSAWATLLRGSARQASARKQAQPASHEQWRVIPLLREDAVAMLTCTPSATARLDARVAAVLLALDGQMASRQLSDLSPQDVREVSGGVSVAGHVFACDHEERVRGVPWDCTACAVRAVVGAHTGVGPLLTAASTSDLGVAITQQLVALRDRSWGGVPMDRSTTSWRTTRLTAAEGLTAWQVAGFRRACVLIAGRRGEAGTWLRARAWTAMAWSCGFRMCGDLLRLDRRSITVDVNGSGYRIDLSATKDDPYGTKQVIRPLAWGTGGISVAGLVAEYLCVRDAVHGPDGSLLVGNLLRRDATAGRGLADGGEGSDGGTVTARRDLQLLGQLAGLAKCPYSSYSTRKGFAEQALRDGWSVEDIRDALRQQTIGVTLNSYLAASSAKDASTKLISLIPRTAS